LQPARPPNLEGHSLAPATFVCRRRQPTGLRRSHPGSSSRARHQHFSNPFPVSWSSQSSLVGNKGKDSLAMSWKHRQYSTSIITEEIVHEPHAGNCRNANDRDSCLSSEHGKRLPSTASLEKKGGKPVQKMRFDLHTGIEPRQRHTRVLRECRGPLPASLLPTDSQDMMMVLWNSAPQFGFSRSEFQN
jgi:hypothetical protein